MKNAFLKKISFKILPFLVGFIHELLLLSCKKVYHLPSSSIPTPVIWACWHGQLMMVPPLFRKIKPVPHKIHVIVSEHRHGDMAISAFKAYEFDYIRGSSRRGAIKALRAAIDKLELQEDVGITPDGPIGPLHSVSDGVIALSSKYNVSVVALGWSASRFWQLKSWDKAQIPKPFSTITFRASEPFSLEGLEKERAKELVYQHLMACMGQK